MRNLVCNLLIRRCQHKTNGSFVSLQNRYFSSRPPVVIGGSNVDIVASVSEDIIMDGRLVNGNISQCRGGVGRNIANALTLLRQDPLFITAIGNDEMGQFLLGGSQHMNTRGFYRCNTHETGCCCVIVDKDKECQLLIGNMSIHSNISLSWIRTFETELLSSSFIILDGNLNSTVLDYICEASRNHNIPLWFEPTDVAVCDKLFKSQHWNAVTHMSPNFNELKHMCSTLTGRDFSQIDPRSREEFIEQSITLAKHIPVNFIMVTLGSHGMVIISDDKAKYYEPLGVENISNVSGAGDCAVAGYITAQLNNLNEDQRVAAALSCARQSLMSTSPVPLKMSLDVSTVPPCGDIQKGT